MIAIPAMIRASRVVRRACARVLRPHIGYRSSSRLRRAAGNTEISYLR